MKWCGDTAKVVDQGFRENDDLPPRTLSSGELFKAFGIYALTLDSLSVPVIDKDAKSNAALLAFVKVSCLLIFGKSSKTCQFDEVRNGNVFGHALRRCMPSAENSTMKM